MAVGQDSSVARLSAFDGIAHMTYLLIIPIIAAGVIALLRFLFGARVFRHLIAVCVGMMIGLVFAFEVLLGPVSGNETAKHMFNFVNAPSTLALSWLPGGVWALFHFSYWAFLGGLVSFGVVTIAAKLAGNE